VVTGEMAHIVAASSQGPRGRVPLNEDELNRAENLILLCEHHHKIVDSRPRTYTVEVLREMKRLHEAPFQAAPAPAEPLPKVSESLLSTLMVVSELPQQVRAAPYLAEDPRRVAAAVRWEPDTGPPPFITRDGRVFAFHDLRHRSGPFSRAVDIGAVETHAMRDLCANDDGARWYVDLLNRSISGHLHRLGMRYDREHRRYYFALGDDDSPPRVEYRSKTGRSMSLEAVKEATYRNGQSKGFWWHQAVALRFLLVAHGCVLSVRPEFHLTSDGREPLDSPLIGRRVTRRKSRIYNDRYIDSIQFWREVITERSPRTVIRVGGQRLTIDNDVLTCDVVSPGVPNDALPLEVGQPDDDLLTLLKDFHMEPDEPDDEDWDDDWDDDDEA
jgi:hypothetical protein